MGHTNRPKSRDLCRQESPSRQQVQPVFTAVIKTTTDASKRDVNQVREAAVSRSWPAQGYQSPELNSAYGMAVLSANNSLTPDHKMWRYLVFLAGVSHCGHKGKNAKKPAACCDGGVHELLHTYGHPHASSVEWRCRGDCVLHVAIRTARTCGEPSRRLGRQEPIYQKWHGSERDAS